MRRMILTSLVLVPVLAHAQAGISTEPKPFASSAVLQAELRQPAGLAAVVKAAAENAASGSGKDHAVVRETVRAEYSGDFAETALREGGTLEYTMRGSAPTQSSAPQVSRAVEVDLSDEELSAQPAVSNVVIHAIVDETGVPRDLSISHSAGTVVDKKALAAISQYRFKPATVDNQPTWASVSIAIKIQKR
jgi:TonB family protein